MPERGDHDGGEIATGRFGRGLEAGRIVVFVMPEMGTILRRDAGDRRRAPRHGAMVSPLADQHLAPTGFGAGQRHTGGRRIRAILGQDRPVGMRDHLDQQLGEFARALSDFNRAINIAPDSQDLAEIAIESANTAKMFDIEPRVAMLSFSTKGSAKSDETEKVSEAVRIAKEKAPELVLDGEFQFDAAFVPSVAAKKAPNSVIKGDASVFVFPSLEAGNIGYKIAQRLGNFEAVGPILQGLNQPVNDLSRGCNAEDVYNLALITAAQAL